MTEDLAADADAPDARLGVVDEDLLEIVEMIFVRRGGGTGPMRGLGAARRRHDVD